MQLKDAIGAFFVEFSKFELHAVGMALRSLSRDAVFVEHAEQLLDLEARLKLLERMAFAREIPPALMSELEACLLHARKVREHRDEVARALASVDRKNTQAMAGMAARPRTGRRRHADYLRLAELDEVWLPALSRVEEYREEAQELQDTLGVITARIERHLNPLAASA